MSLSPEISKVEDYAEFSRFVRELGRRKYPGGYTSIVFTNGCFDLLHPGHLEVLSHARGVSGPRGAVVVGINSDESVRRLKGDSRPILDEDSRGILLSCLRQVDHVVTFSEDTPLKLIEELRPDFIVKGGDYDPLNVVGKNLAPVIVSEFDDRWSTSAIIQRIRGST